MYKKRIIFFEHITYIQYLVSVKKEELILYELLNTAPFYVILKFDSQSQFVTNYSNRILFKARTEGILNERKIF